MRIEGPYSGPCSQPWYSVWSLPKFNLECESGAIQDRLQSCARPGCVRKYGFLRDRRQWAWAQVSFPPPLFGAR